MGLPIRLATGVRGLHLLPLVAGPGVAQGTTTMTTFNDDHYLHRRRPSSTAIADDDRTTTVPLVLLQAVAGCYGRVLIAPVWMCRRGLCADLS